MSKWRQRGFVQDSDEDEEESQIESQHSRHGALLDTRVDRVDKGHEVRGVDRQQPEVPDDGQHGNAIRAYSSSLERGVSPERPIISLPTTPTVGPALQQEPPESPDPLQSSPTQKAQWQTLSLSSQLLGSSTHQRSPTALATKPNHGQAAPSQPSSSARVVQKTTSASEVLVHFGITPLSDDSDNESLLSDPPSDMDLESPPLAPMSYVSPHRRTAVQVVIPSMAA
jgi:FtsZ-interacting cell division protein ZipA